MFTRASPICRRCVADVSGTFLALVYIAECSPTARRCSAICRRWYLASKYREKISMHALKFFSMSRCLDEASRLLAYVADHSPNHWCMVALLWRCPNLCIARASGGLKSLVAWDNTPDTGFEIWTLAVWGQIRYLSFTEAPYNIDFLRRRNILFLWNLEARGGGGG